MPTFLSIARVGVWLDDVEDQEDADYASSVAGSIEGEDLHTVVTLAEQLAELTATVPGLRIAVRAGMAGFNDPRDGASRACEASPAELTA
jgi:hypothetical protein